MNIRYVLSVLLVTVVMVAGIYAYFKYLVYFDALKLAESTKATTTAPVLSPRAQEEVKELDLLREAAKEQTPITTTIKRESASLDLARKEAQKQVVSSKVSPAPINKTKTVEQEIQELDALRAQAQAQLTNQ